MSACEHCPNPLGLTVFELNYLECLSELKFSTRLLLDRAVEFARSEISEDEEDDFQSKATQIKDRIEAIAIGEQAIEEIAEVDCLVLGCQVVNFCPKYERLDERAINMVKIAEHMEEL